MPKDILIRFYINAKLHKTNLLKFEDDCRDTLYSVFRTEAGGKSYELTSIVAYGFDAHNKKHRVDMPAMATIDYINESLFPGNSGTPPSIEFYATSFASPHSSSESGEIVESVSHLKSHHSSSKDNSSSRHQPSNHPDGELYDPSAGGDLLPFVFGQMEVSVQANYVLGSYVLYQSYHQHKLATREATDFALNCSEATFEGHFPPLEDINYGLPSDYACLIEIQPTKEIKAKKIMKYLDGEVEDKVALLCNNLNTTEPMRMLLFRRSPYLRAELKRYIKRYDERKDKLEFVNSEPAPLFALLFSDVAIGECDGKRGKKKPEASREKAKQTIEKQNQSVQLPFGWIHNDLANPSPAHHPMHLYTLPPPPGTARTPPQASTLSTQPVMDAGPASTGAVDPRLKQSTRFQDMDTIPNSSNSLPNHNNNPVPLQHQQAAPMTTAFNMGMIQSAPLQSVPNVPMNAMNTNMNVQQQMAPPILQAPPLNNQVPSSSSPQTSSISPPVKPQPPAHQLRAMNDRVSKAMMSFGDWIDSRGGRISSDTMFEFRKDRRHASDVIDDAKAETGESFTNMLNKYPESRVWRDTTGQPFGFTTDDPFEDVRNPSQSQLLQRERIEADLAYKKACRQYEAHMSGGRVSNRDGNSSDRDGYYNNTNNNSSSSSSSSNNGSQYGPSNGDRRRERDDFYRDRDRDPKRSRHGEYDDYVEDITDPCWHYDQKGYCFWGRKCRMYHAPRSVAPAKPSEDQVNSAFKELCEFVKSEGVYYDDLSTATVAHYALPYETGYDMFASKKTEAQQIFIDYLYHDVLFDNIGKMLCGQKYERFNLHLKRASVKELKDLKAWEPSSNSASMRTLLTYRERREVPIDRSIGSGGAGKNVYIDVGVDDDDDDGEDMDTTGDNEASESQSQIITQESQQGGDISASTDDGIGQDNDNVTGPDVDIDANPDGKDVATNDDSSTDNGKFNWKALAAKNNLESLTKKQLEDVCREINADSSDFHVGNYHNKIKAVVVEEVMQHFKKEST